jgi:DNA polymerase III epsilon subunit-like protein
MSNLFGTVYTKSGFIPKYGLCIDWETSGSNFDGDSSIDYQGIAFGAAVFNTDDFSIVDKMKRYIKFDNKKYKWSNDAEKIHGLTREFLDKNGKTQEEAAIDLGNFVLTYFGITPKVLILGHNVDFDIAFTKQLLEPYDIMFKIHHVKLDTSSAGLIAFNKFKSNDLFKLIGLENRNEHDPLQDVEYTIELAKSIRLLINYALEK